MDREKLEIAAEKSAAVAYRNLSDPDVSQDGQTVYMFASMFVQGAEWLQSQPIADRLTEGDVNNLNDVMFLMRRMAASHQMSYDCLKQISNTLYDVFGKEIFIERQSKYAVVNTAIFGKEMFQK